MSNPTREYGTPDRWFVLVFLALDYFVLYLHRNLINFVQPPLKADLLISEEEIGALQTAFVVPYALSQLFVGYLGDRFDRRMVLILSLIGSVATLVGMGLVTSYAGLMVLRVILGFAQAASVPAIAGMMADCFTPKGRSTAVAVYLVSRNVALIIAGVYGGKIADIPSWNLSWLGMPEVEVAGWRMSMFIFALVGMVVVLAMSLLLREPARTERETGRGLGTEGGSLWNTARSVVAVPSYLLLAAVFVLSAGIMNITEFWLARFFVESRGMNLEQAGWNATVYMQVGTIVGMFLGGWWADRLARRFRSGRLWVCVVAFALRGPALAVVGTTSSDTVLIASLLVLGLGEGFYVTNLWTTVFDVVDPAARSTATAYLNVAATIAAPASQFVGRGVDHEWFSLAQAIAMLSIPSLLSLVLLLLTIFVFLRRDYRGPLT